MNLSINPQVNNTIAKPTFNAKLVIRKNTLDTNIAKELKEKFSEATKEEMGTLLIAPAKNRNDKKLVAGFGIGEFEAFGKFFDDGIFTDKKTSNQDKVLEKIMNIYNYFKSKAKTNEVVENTAIKDAENKAKLDKVVNSLEFFNS